MLAGESLYNRASAGSAFLSSGPFVANSLSSDFNTGSFSWHLSDEETIELHSDHTSIGVSLRTTQLLQSPPL